MGAVEELLADAGRRIEPEVRSRLQGLFGGFVRAYLPQAWVFVTESETATLRVDVRGSVTVVPGATDAPDVTVELSVARLRAALTSRRPSAGTTGKISVTPHTSKGKAAFDYLRDRVGL